MKAGLEAALQAASSRGASYSRMGDPATLVESAAPPLVTAGPAGETQDGAKAQPASKNGKKADSGSSSSSGFFTWFIVLALLGVWTSVAVVYFDLVDYQGVLGKLAAYDTDGDGDFDVEDAKVLLDDKAAEGPCREAVKETASARDVGLKLREALKQQLALIHERVEAKKLAKLALAEVRLLLAKEEEEKELDLGRKEISARVRERVARRLREEEEKMEEEEVAKALVKGQKEQAKPDQEEEEEEEEKALEDQEGEKKSKKKGEKVAGKEAKSGEREKLTLKEKWRKIRADKSAKGSKK